MSFELSEAQLSRAEGLLGARFPESYRRAMLLHNGGAREVDGEVWELLPIDDHRSIRRWSRTGEDVLGWTDEFRMWRTWPKSAISIARNGCGDALLFLKEHGRMGPEVYVWRHETGAVEKIAADFSGVQHSTARRH
jgi:hypothetical protein